MPSEREKPLMDKEKKKAVAPFKASATPSWSLLLNPLAWLLWTLDFLIWLLTIVGPLKTLSWYLRGKYSVEIDTATRRHPEAVVKGMTVSAVVDGGEDVVTVSALLNYMAAKYPKEPAMGTRTYLGEHKPEGARFPLKKFGETTWITFAELKARALSFGAALVSTKVGMEPMPKGCDLERATGAHTLLLFEDTSAEWMTAALGALSYSLAVATSYATLGIEAVGEAVNESSVKVIMTNRRQVDKVAKLRAKCPSLATIVYTDVNVAPADMATAPAPPSGMSLMSFEDAIALGDALGDARAAPVPATPETTALIMYTSGSTGKPKGVMLKHQSICSSIGGIARVLKTMSPTVGKCYLAYLPQAHILEFCAELTCMSLGCKLGYADPRTLSSTGAVRERPDGTLNTKGEYPYPPGAIQEFAPAFMAGVPKIWDILKKAFEDQIARKSPVAKMIFQIAFVGRAAALRQHRESPLLKALVFNKLAKLLGGNLRATVSGGGAISSEVQTFVRTAFGAPCIQGYALTETCCSATIQMPDAQNFDGVAGSPLSSIEIRLAPCDIADKAGIKYSPTDTIHLGKACRGRGEVQMRGPPVSAGYYKQPDKTAEVFSADGWFASGDVGIWRPDGQLQIVDRVKNLIKTKGGEYIAIESMEKEYSTCAYVSGTNGGIMCYGDGDMDRPVAFVMADEKKLTAWADANGVAFESFKALCKSPEANKEVLDALNKAGKSGNLSGNELLLGVELFPGTGPTTNIPPTMEDPWTPENGMLTASNKLQRKQILAAFGAAGVFEKLKAKGIR